MRLALYTFGVFRQPADDPVNQGFHDRNDPILELVDRSPGLIARSGYEDEPGPESWGTQVFPRFYVERGDEWSPSTLSLWVDMESAMAFAYHGLHAEAMRHAREWFDPPEWPPYAAWWVPDGATPDWADAVKRHEHLHDNGPSAYCFTFKQAFGPDGSPARIDAQCVLAIAKAGKSGLRKVD